MIFIERPTHYVCINNKHLKREFTEGKIYTLIGNSVEGVLTVNDFGQTIFVDIERFKVSDEYDPYLDIINKTDNEVKEFIEKYGI
jgi:hypothetical protein